MELNKNFRKRRLSIQKSFIVRNNMTLQHIPKTPEPTLGHRVEDISGSDQRTFDSMKHSQIEEEKNSQHSTPRSPQAISKDSISKGSEKESPQDQMSPSRTKT